MEKIAALENLKKEWEAYQTFCLDFIKTFEEKYTGRRQYKDFWTTTELERFAGSAFEPQIHRLETSVNTAYDITARLKIAGYSRDEMAQLIYKIAERPHGFSAEKQWLIQGIISGLDAVLEAAIKPARAEVEALIKSLLAWQNEQPEFTTGLEPDEDRILNPVDKLRLARLADKAKVFLQDSPSHKNVLQSFVTALSTNNIPATLMTGTKLLDVLCELRHTLPKTGTAGDTTQATPETDVAEKKWYLKPVIIAALITAVATILAPVIVWFLNSHSNKQGVSIQKNISALIETKTDGASSPAINNMAGPNSRITNIVNYGSPPENKTTKKRQEANTPADYKKTSPSDQTKIIDPNRNSP